MPTSDPKEVTSELKTADLALVVATPGCPNSSMMIRIVQRGESTIVTVLIDGEQASESVDSSGTETVGGVFTCPATGEPMNVDITPDVSWGEVSSASDLDIQ